MTTFKLKIKISFSVFDMILVTLVRIARQIQLVMFVGAKL